MCGGLYYRNATRYCFACKGAMFGGFFIGIHPECFSTFGCGIMLTDDVTMKFVSLLMVDS